MPAEVPDRGSHRQLVRPWPPRERGPALDLVSDLHLASRPLTRDVLASRLADDVVMTPPPALGSPFKPYFGVEGVVRWLADSERRWPGLRVVPEAYAAAGDHVAVLGRLVLDDEREEEAAWLWSVRDGRVGAVRGFRYASEALVRLDALAARDPRFT